MQTNHIVSLIFVVSNHTHMAQYLFCAHTSRILSPYVHFFSYNELCCVQRYTRKGAVNQRLLPVPHGFFSSQISLFFRYKICECAASLKYILENSMHGKSKKGTQMLLAKRKALLGKSKKCRQHWNGSSKHPTEIQSLDESTPRLGRIFLIFSCEAEVSKLPKHRLFNLRKN